MAGVRSKRLFGPVGAPVPPTLVYTVPAGRTARILNFCVIGVLPPGAAITFYLNGTAATNAIARVTREETPDGMLRGVWVAEPGNTIHCGGGAIGLALGVSAHGSLLLGPPE